MRHTFKRLSHPYPFGGSAPHSGANETVSDASATMQHGRNLFAGSPVVEPDEVANIFRVGIKSTISPVVSGRGIAGVLGENEQYSSLTMYCLPMIITIFGLTIVPTVITTILLLYSV